MGRPATHEEIMKEARLTDIIAACIVGGCAKPAKTRGMCWVHYGRWFRHGDPRKGRAAPGAPHRWFEDVAMRHAGGDCLEWPFGKFRDGYGQITRDGVMMRAHRVMCQRIHGDPPEPTLDAAHNCGNRACVNARHLRWATRKANIADMKAHGTVNYGRRNGSVKLTESDVIAIRGATGTQESIAARFGVSRRLISMIRRREVWAWLPDKSTGQERGLI